MAYAIAYAIADHYRSRGVRVCLGGLRVTSLRMRRSCTPITSSGSFVFGRWPGSCSPTQPAVGPCLVRFRPRVHDADAAVAPQTPLEVPW